nr:hypothetical protein [Tanacetum cinerariifolium]GEZ90141.1 hypothetical protein [Tanacetum cinerariifolium]
MTAGMSRQYTSGPSGTSGKQRVIICYNCKGEGHMSKQYTKPKRKRDETWFKDKVPLVQAQANGQVLHKEELIALMANLSHYGSNNLAENSSSPAKQDDLILFVIEQLNTQVVNCTKINQDNKNFNEFLTAELERYKDQKVNTKPVDYAALTQLLQDFETRFVPQNELSAEQAFWSRYLVNSEEPNISSSTNIVEVPKELPKVSMVNSSLKKLKFHLASFDVAVEQHCVDKNKFQDKMNDVLKENERLLEQAISAGIVNIVVHANVNYACKTMNECERCVTIETELQRDFIKRECYDTLFK